MDYISEKFYSKKCESVVNIVYMYKSIACIKVKNVCFFIIK